MDFGGVEHEFSLSYSLCCLVFRLEFEFDVVAFDAYCVAGHTSWRRQAQHAPGCDIKNGAVPGAGHFCPHNATFGERSASMGAGIVDRVVGSIDVEDRDLPRQTLDGGL